MKKMYVMLSIYMFFFVGPNGDVTAHEDKANKRERSVEEFDMERDMEKRWGHDIKDKIEGWKSRMIKPKGF